jgi:aspartokinase/homoserine dehydrogenase 1
VLCLEDGAEVDEVAGRLLQYKQGGGKIEDLRGAQRLPDLGALVAAHSGPRSIWVDCTASSQTTGVLINVLEKGSGIVLANKKPLTADQAIFDRFRGEVRPNRHCRWEATVGAALPVMSALERLEACGDQVSHITGTLSGTLGFLMSGLEQGGLFSSLVEVARGAGYTEPDPREDLGGLDVARKALILARMIGWRIEFSEVSVEKLYPVEMEELSSEDFMHRLPMLDGQLSSRIEAARRRGKVLRYGAFVKDSQCRVGLIERAKDTALGRLNGVNQLVEIYSRWHNPDPLVIVGRGAGVEATASAVLSDLVDLASQRL